MPRSLRDFRASPRVPGRPMVAGDVVHFPVRFGLTGISAGANRGRASAEAELAGGLVCVTLA